MCEDARATCFAFCHQSPGKKAVICHKRQSTWRLTIRSFFSVTLSLSLLSSIAGVSRSVTITVAYLMSILELDSKQALKCVQGGRSIASPNEGFVKQLHDFEGRRLREVT